MTLTPAQRAIIDSAAPSILVAATAGSGKSRVLIERIKRLIRDGVSPNRIVTLSYTVAASAVLRERLGDVKLGCNSTIHSWLLNLLNQHGSLVGLRAPLSVVDADEEKALLADAIDEMAYRGSLRDVEAEVAKGPTPRLNPMTKPQIAAECFWQKLKADGVLNFDGILYWGLKLLTASRAVNADYLFVDEGQDMSAKDWAIIDAAQVPNTMVIGDDDQQIYSFRGASEQFTKRCLTDNAARLFTLQENFRCCSEVCGIANRLMIHQPGRVQKQTISATGETGEVIIKADGFERDDQEAHAVAEDIYDSSFRPADCAVLVRTNHLADYFRTVLKAHGLPVKEKAKSELPKDWQRAKAALSLLANPDNDRLAYQAIKLASGRQKADEVRRHAVENYRTINDTALFLPAGMLAGQAIDQLAKMGISRESLDRIGAAAGLLSSDAAVNDLILALGRQADDEVEGGGIDVRTLHGSKGGEWQAVWLPAWEQETLPGSRKDTDEAESRRLSFVGITRTRSYLWISWAKRRAQQWGPPKECTASRYIAEVQP